MMYFQRYLTDQTNADDIDISVHCDIKIFEWLMRYLRQSEGLEKDSPGQYVKLDIKNVISILISSDFL